MWLSGVAAAKDGGIDKTEAGVGTAAGPAQDCQV